MSNEINCILSSSPSSEFTVIAFSYNATPLLKPNIKNKTKMAISIVLVSTTKNSPQNLQKDKKNFDNLPFTMPFDIFVEERTLLKLHSTEYDIFVSTHLYFK